MNACRHLNEFTISASCHNVGVNSAGPWRSVHCAMTVVQMYRVGQIK